MKSLRIGCQLYLYTINLCYNLKCFEFRPGIINDRMLGEFCLEEDRLDWIHIFEVDVRKLLDPQRVGMDQRKEEMGIFTSKGYVFENALSYQDIYDGIHLPDIDGVAGGIFSLRLSDLNIRKNREPG